MLSLPAGAAETISLDAYLRDAQTAGFNVVFSNQVVLPRYRVTRPENNHITMDQIVDVLRAHGLALKQVGDSLIVTGPGPGHAIAVEAPPAYRDSEPPEIEEIIVSSSLYRLSMNHILDRNELSRDDIAMRPVVANDAFRSVHHLPGVASDGISARPRVRGGREDETYIQFNGIRLYEPYHLKEFGGLFGTVDQRIVDAFEFISGGFSADYGDRLSAVWKIDTLTPEELAGTREIGFGLYTASYLQAGGHGDHYYMFDARRSTSEIFTKLTGSDIGRPTFGDLYARYDRTLADGTLSANLLVYIDDAHINDTSRSENATSEYANVYFWLIWKRDLDWASSTTTFSVTTIRNAREGIVNNPAQVSGWLMDDQEFRIYGINQVFEVDLARTSTMAMGLEYRYLDGEYDFDSRIQIAPEFAGLSNFDRSPVTALTRRIIGHQVAGHLSYKRRLWAGLYGEIGVRADLQSHLKAQWTHQVDPRLNLLYRWSDGTALRLAWGQFSQTQGINELQISDGEDAFQRPQRAEHLVFGISHYFPDHGIDARLELYRKEGDRTHLYFENLINQVTLVPELQADRHRVNTDHFVAEGGELSIAGEFGQQQWWLNYAYASVIDQVGGQRQRRSWDQRHAVNVGLNMPLSAWQWSIAASYHAGWRLTPVVLNDSGRLTPLARNSERVKPFLSINTKLNRTWQFSGTRQLQLDLGISNLANRDNELGRDYAIDDDMLLIETSSSLRLAPFLDVYWTF